MGNVCGFQGLAGHVLKHRVNCELTNLLYKCIEDCVVDFRLFNSVYEVEAKRLQNFKNQMSIVKSLSDDWRNITQLCLDSDKPPHVTVRRSLSLMPESNNTMKISHVLCLCTYVLDVCVLSLSANKPINVCKVVEILVEYLVEKNVDVCVEFLEFIDAL